ncbi:riboflavin biosynthesis protein RibD domain-containing protein [Colletotrichum caudatum]|nr:riboflavin biosynthesis protein RibD domain-containing protein [Colletotrichum caudatum]
MEPPRRLRYNVAISLDGFIVPPGGTRGWIAHDNSISFDDICLQFDTLVMGRKTYECMLNMGGHYLLQKYTKENLVVVSKTLKSEHHPRITIVSEEFTGYIAGLKNGDGRDIWLVGGGQLVGPCLDAGILDTVETAIMPLMLRKGERMIGEPAPRRFGEIRLDLVDCRQRGTGGIVVCKYNVSRQMAASMEEAMFC